MDTSKGSAAKTLLLVGLIAAGAALLVTGSYEVSYERIVANEREALLRQRVLKGTGSSGDDGGR